jgi:hypothetical protein
MGTLERSGLPILTKGCSYDIDVQACWYVVDTCYRRLESSRTCMSCIGGAKDTKVIACRVKVNRDLHGVNHSSISSDGPCGPISGQILIVFEAVFLSRGRYNSGNLGVAGE